MKKSQNDRKSREANYHDSLAMDGSIRKRAEEWYHPEILKIIYGAMYDKLGIEKYHKVLELGCGDGERLIRISDKAHSLIGIDISQEFISKGNKLLVERNINNIQLICGDAEDIRFRFSCDRIFGVAILHHLSMNEIGEVIWSTLNPGGRAVFLEPLAYNPFINLYRYLTPKMRTPDEHPLQLSELQKLSESFDDLNWYAFNFFTLFGVGISKFIKFENRKKAKFFKLMKFLHKVDQILFRGFPPFKFLGWNIIIVMDKHSHKNRS